MGRVRRVDVGGMIYHALNRANFRSRLFQQKAHYQDFLGIMEEVGGRVSWVRKSGRVSEGCQSEGCQVPFLFLTTPNRKDPLSDPLSSLGLVDGLGGPISITGAFIDWFDYGIHHNEGRIVSETVSVRNGVRYRFSVAPACAGCFASRIAPLPAPPSSPSHTACCVGGHSGCSQSPPCLATG